MISVLLPSRKRPDLLIRCIKSIVDTADNKDAFEICLRIHRDDSETIARLPYILSLCTVRVVIGLQHRGYTDLCWFYQEAAAISRGDWIWVMNDDAVSVTKGWDTMVHSQPNNVIVMPERHKLGGSTYINDGHNPFMYLPNKAWEKYGMKRFTTPFDLSLWTLFRNNGWQTVFIPTEIFHDWHPDKNTEERKTEISTNFDNDPHEHYMENL